MVLRRDRLLALVCSGAHLVPGQLKALIQRFHEPCPSDGSFPGQRLGGDNVPLVSYSGVTQGCQAVLVSDGWCP